MSNIFKEYKKHRKNIGSIQGKKNNFPDHHVQIPSKPLNDSDMLIIFETPQKTSFITSIRVQFKHPAK